MSVTLIACGDDENVEDPTPTNAPSSATATNPAAASEEPGTVSTITTEEGKEIMQWSSAPEMQLEQGKDYQATIHTNKGDIVIDLLETEAPITVNNFVFLANNGFYADVPFHRIVKDFMIQTGDPTGTGSGGPGYRFNDEPITRNYVKGTVAMANAGPNTNGSQFFITHADVGLPKNYTIFGEVIEGIDVVDAIANVPVSPNPKMRGEVSMPDESIVMESVEISTK